MIKLTFLMVVQRQTLHVVLPLQIIWGDGNKHETRENASRFLPKPHIIHNITQHLILIITPVSGR